MWAEIYNGSHHFLTVVQCDGVVVLDCEIMDPIIVIVALVIITVEISIRLL